MVGRREFTRGSGIPSRSEREGDMFVKVLRGFTVVAALLITAAPAWKQFGTSKGNNLVDEGRAIYLAAVAKAAEAAPRFAELNADANLKGFPGNRAQLEPQSGAVAEMFGSVVEQYRAAGAKFDAAAKQPTEKIVAEYWSLLGQEFAKSAEKYGLMREYVLLVTDPKIESSDALIARRAEIDIKLGAIVKQEKALSDQSDKIKAEYPDLLQ